MARGKGRGGYQQPRSPAPVSGPGALSQRTDGQQPVRVPTGGPYGQAGQLAAAQRAQPLPAVSAPRPAAGGGPRGPGPQIADPFRPTERPGEPPTAGIPVGPGPMGVQLVAEDADMLVRAALETLTQNGLTSAAARLAPLLRRG